MTAEWISLHAFYASDSNPMLVDAVQPLIADLRAAGLLERWFFIKYWMEGPHVRLRLKPKSEEVAEKVRDTANEYLEEFLRVRPSLYEVDQDATSDLYKKMYIAEYGEDGWNEAYGESDQMPFRENNSVHEIAYEREWDRYGGPHGMELSEWHFEHSSDLVLHLCSTTNVHVRPVMLGLSVQFSLALCYVFLETDEAVMDFLGQYRNFWETSYQEGSEAYHSSFDKSFARMEEDLDERIRQIRRAALGSEPASLTPLEREWVDHARTLRARIEALVAERKLVFSPREASSERKPMEDVHGALSILLSSFVHMTNNRLGVSILDEIYLSYVIERALGAEAAADTVDEAAAEASR